MNRTFIDSTIDLPATAYTVISIGAGDGRITTHQATMSIDEAAQLLLARLEGFDWSGFEACGNERQHARHAALQEGLQEILDIASLVAEINLYEARLLWNIKVSARIGVPRMLAESFEASELLYIRNLAAQRVLQGAELAEHLLLEGGFMDQWSRDRREFVEYGGDVSGPMRRSASTFR